MTPEETRQKLIHSLDKNVLAALAAKNFDVFASVMLPEHFKNPPSIFHRYLMSTISENQMTSKREVIVGPRGWGKSTTISEGGIAWIICRDNYLPPEQQYKYIMLISDSAKQAKERLESIKAMLTSEPMIAEYYPHVFGEGKIWREDRIVTKNDILVDTRGMTASSRGTKYKNRRPSLIVCHEKGTPMLDVDGWHPVEEHSSFKKTIKTSGKEIKVWGYHFTEKVSDDHRYWAKNWDYFKGSVPPRWVEARNLTKTDYIGYPIDMYVGQVQPIEKYVSGDITERNEKGQVVYACGHYELRIHKPMLDPDFWWLIGYWWGNGHTTKTQVGFTINNAHTHVFKKIDAILARYNKPFSLVPQQGCTQYVFTDTALARWLKTWRTGNSRKCPPLWVEQLPFNFQKELVKGYVDSDGYIDKKGGGVRITSIHVPGLLSLSRILARLGIPSTIRKGPGSRVETFPNGCTCVSQPKYDIRFREGAQELGYDIPPQTRYSINRTHIENGFVWRKVKEIYDVPELEVCPIKTASHMYITAFGLSHNCDDIDSMDTAMSPTMAEDLQERFTKDVLKFGDKKTDVIVVGTVLSKLCLVYKLLYADEFASWNGRIVKALEKFPERMDLWDKWGSILNNRKISNRAEAAELFYSQNQDEMEKGGQSNWPEVWPVKDLMYEYYTLGRRAFMSEMQNQITDSELNHFQPHKYTYINADEFKNLMDSHPIIYAYVDPTVGIQKKTRINSRGSDMFNITLVAKFDSGFYALVESISRQCRQSEQYDMILDVLKKYNVFRLMVESNGGQMHYINGLEKAIFEKYAEPGYAATCNTKYPLKPRAVNNSASKDERIQMLEPYLDNKTLHLREDMQTSSPELWESLSTYPACEYMDPLDGLSGAFFSAYRTYRLSYLNQAAS